jgi:hypothetical protein
MQATASPINAADFIVETIFAHPGEITVLALAACTNVALALKKDSSLHTKWKELVILGGAFQTSGNVNPAAEANIFGDAEAAEYVLSRATNVRMVGLDVTHSCHLTGTQLQTMRGETSEACVSITYMHCGEIKCFVPAACTQNHMVKPLNRQGRATSALLCWTRHLGMDGKCGLPEMGSGSSCIVLALRPRTCEYISDTRQSSLHVVLFFW